MAVIEKKIRLVGSLGKAEERALFDSGSTYSCIHPQLAKRLGVTESLPSPKRFGTAEKGRTVTARERVSLDFRLNGYTFSDEFMVVSGLTEPVIIGAATLQKWRMKLDFENDDVIIDPRVTKLRLMSMS
jgi:hypothetical protein